MSVKYAEPEDGWLADELKHTELEHRIAVLRADEMYHRLALAKVRKLLAKTKDELIAFETREDRPKWREGAEKAE